MPNPERAAERERRSTVELVGAGLLATAAMGILAQVVVMVRRGLELTDSAYAWLMMAAPDAAGQTLTMAGYVLHAPWRVTSGNLLVLRSLNAATTFAITATLAWLLLEQGHTHRATRGPGRFETWYRLGLAVSIGGAGLAGYYLWLAPPGYKSLALQAGLVVACGLVTSDGAVRGEVLAGLALGLGGFLLFMAKPPSAALVAVVAGVHLRAAGRWRWRGLVAVATATTLVILVSWQAFGSPSRMVSWLLESAALSSILLPSRTLLGSVRIDLPPLTPGMAAALLALAGALVAAWHGRTVSAVHTRLPRRSVDRVIVVACLAVLSLVVVQGVWGVWAPSYDPLLGLVPLVIALVAFMRRARSGHGRGQRMIDGGFLLLLPFLLAFGSNRNYWSEAGLHLACWICAGLAFLVVDDAGGRPSESPHAGIPGLLGYAGVCLVAASMLVETGIQDPYRQESSLRAMSAIPTEARPELRFRMGAGAAAYVDDVSRARLDAGVQRGDPFLDMTGRSPGTVFVAGGRGLGRAWIPGGYPGSEDYAIALLAREPCDEIARAWVLVEPNGPRSLSDRVLASVGVDAARDLVVVDTFERPDGSEQRLLAPARDPAQAVEDCEERRAADPQS